MQPTVSPWDRDLKLIRIAISLPGRPLKASKTVLEFLVGVRDAILGHRRLHDRGILHGDISEGNVILTLPTARDESKGLLINLDHSVGMSESLQTDDDQNLIGTMKFMALERLYYVSEEKSIIPRTYCHDLESFFYVFLTGCIEYELVPQSKSYDLQNWCTSKLDKKKKKKKASHINNFEKIVLKKFTPSFVGLKELAKTLRMILFGKYGNDFGTPHDCRPMYYEIIKSFNKTIEQITGKVYL
ncbi:Bgt-51685 [Blumeria graminis f. sp. tritici]|uniref:non-specific serine/threonine protein kinase n=1 Tax=Blumeria graminis f. sp. tritici TaxID=62690 RepID=A0A9X9MES3_BLUGR|nr:Bgt-51685 [Blumeria graminis f. sp. tritici]